MSLPPRNPRNFDNDKIQCLGKRDKSFAGRIDPKAVDICAEINARKDFYTTSSCSGRCFLYRGMGIKATTDFKRFRTSHDLIYEPQRYFDLTTLDSDPTGGADPLRTIGQFEHAELVQQQQGETHEEFQLESDRGLYFANGSEHDHSGDFITEEKASAKSLEFSNASNTDEALVEGVETATPGNKPSHQDNSQEIVWLRFEPFILHVCCRSLAASAELAAAARQGGFKNVGLTSWKDAKYILAIWGDEGLDMPLGTFDSDMSYLSRQGGDSTDNFQQMALWLAAQVNERHGRNWNKIQRFVQSVRSMPECSHEDNTTYEDNISGTTGVPRSYDVIGDVALLHVLPAVAESDREAIGNAIMKRNKSIKVRADSKASDGLSIINLSTNCVFISWLLFALPH